MAKLTKAQSRAHDAACALLESGRPLKEEEIVQIIDSWHEGAVHANTKASAHFTPFDLARHAALEVNGRSVLDLCAGIGTLSVAVQLMTCPGDDVHFTMVEINPDYAKVAQRLMPDAEIIVGSMYDRGLIEELRSRQFDTCISNPPFGNFSKSPGSQPPRYRGGEAHYDCIDIASDLADSGVFILPQSAVPFRYSGQQGYEKVPYGKNPKYDRFLDQTGIELGANLGIDTSVLPGFRDVNITVEISTVDFIEARQKRLEAEAPLFARQAA